MSAESLDSRVGAIRTVALVGPAAAGKTLLLDALLAHAGVIPQAGSIERGTRSSLNKSSSHSPVWMLNSSVRDALVASVA